MDPIQSVGLVYWQKRWFRISLITALIFTLILLLLPIIMQWGLSHQLKKQGATEATIEDIDFNPFAGTLQLEQLRISGGQTEPAVIELLSVDLKMLDLLRGRLLLNQATLSGLSMIIDRDDQGSVSINGIPVFPFAQNGQPAAVDEADGTDETAEPMAYGINRLQFEDLQISYNEPEFTQQAQIESLNLENLHSWDPAQTAVMNLEMTLDQADLSVTSELNLFSETRKISGTLGVDALSFEPYAKFYRTHIDRLQGDISLDSSFALAIGEDISADVENSISINNLDADYQQLTHTSKSLRWQGQSRYAEGKLQLTGNLQIDDSLTLDRNQDYQLYAFDQLTLSGLNQDPQRITFDQFSIDQLRIIDQLEENAFVDLKRLELNGLSYSMDKPELQIKLINLSQPQVSLLIDAQKKPAHLTPLLTTLDGLKTPETDTTETMPAESAEQKKQALSLLIEELRLTEPGNVEIIDRSISPNYKSRIELLSIELSNISSQQPASFKLALKQGDYTSFDIEGQGLLFAPTEDLELKAIIKQLDLPPVTSYTSNSIGYGMKSGTVDSDINLKLKQHVIDSVVDLKIDSIEVVETDKQSAEQVSSAAGMSIDLAISTLKDKNNVIELKLPIKGNIDDPDFDLNDVLRKATGKAMQSASLAYLKYSLQPFGSLITLYKLAKAAADQIALPPVEFAANSLEFDVQQQELLNKVVKLLQDRPALKIKVCGVSAQQDQQAIAAVMLEEKKELLKKEGKSVDKVEIDQTQLQDKMKELADARSARVKTYLLEQSGLEPSRVLNCLSSTDTEKDVSPSVQLLL